MKDGDDDKTAALQHTFAEEEEEQTHTTLVKIEADATLRKTVSKSAIEVLLYSELAPT